MRREADRSRARRRDPHMKRKGKMWIRVFPQKSFTKSARNPHGQGPKRPSKAGSRSSSGDIVFEWTVHGKPKPRESMRLAAPKLPIKTKKLFRASSRALNL